MSDEQEMADAVQRFALALSEVNVIYRREGGIIVGRIIRNKDALQRARKAYTTACSAIAHIRLEDGTATGRTPASKERASVKAAMARLDDLTRQLQDLEGIE